MYGRLEGRCTSSEFVERFLSSVSMHAPKSHFIPKKEVRWRAGARQRYRLDFEERIYDLCVNAELNLIAVTQKREIHVFDLVSMQTVRTLKGHDSDVFWVGMSGDGSRIVSGSDEGAVRVWDGKSGECVVGPLRGHEDWVQCAGMSGDGSRIVSGSDDGTVRVWDGRTGEERFAAVNFAGDLRSIEFEDYSGVCVISTSEEVFRLDTSSGAKMPSPGYMLENSGKIFVSGENAETVQFEVVPFRVHTFCFNKQHSKAVAGLGDGQVVIGELIL